MKTKKILLTPGPLTTSDDVKAPMQYDFGSRDADFIRLIADIRRELMAIAGAGEDYTVVPVQGSGTFAVESCITSLVKKSDHLLILSNGAYGKRIQLLCSYAGVPYSVIEHKESEPICPDTLEQSLLTNPAITHVAVVYNETTTGIVNPVEAISKTVQAHGKQLVIDAMSAFGAFPSDVNQLRYTALMASSNKCLHGVPGLGFVIVRKDMLENAKGNCPSLSLDLYAQWHTLETTGQFRFTPPVQVLAAFSSAIREFNAEGGVLGRRKRYEGNFAVLYNGMIDLGFKLYLDPKHQGPIIVTFLYPKHPNFHFETFYTKLSDKGFVIYPGKLTDADTFRVGCIGDITAEDMKGFIEAVRLSKEEMNF